ncbi:hypothetical protein CBL_01214 [Carabus blaptoides fortunei]
MSSLLARLPVKKSSEDKRRVGGYQSGTGGDGGDPVTLMEQDTNRVFPTKVCLIPLSGRPFFEGAIAAGPRAQKWVTRLPPKSARQVNSGTTTPCTVHALQCHNEGIFNKCKLE